MFSFSLILKHYGYTKSGELRYGANRYAYLINEAPLDIKIKTIEDLLPDVKEKLELKEKEQSDVRKKLDLIEELKNLERVECDIHLRWKLIDSILGRSIKRNLMSKRNTSSQRVKENYLKARAEVNFQEFLLLNFSVNMEKAYKSILKELNCLYRCRNEFLIEQELTNRSNYDKHIFSLISSYCQIVSE